MTAKYESEFKGAMAGLTIIVIFILGSIAVLDSSEEHSQDQNVSMPDELNRSEAVQNCMEANGFVTNMSGVNNNTVYEVCKWS